MRFSIFVEVNIETRTAYLEVSKYPNPTKRYTITDEKKQRSLCKLLNSDKIVYQRYGAKSSDIASWSKLPNPQGTEAVIEVGEKEDYSDFLNGRPEGKPDLI